MLRLYTFVIIGVVGITVVLGGFFGFEPTYRSDTTYLVVVNEQSVSGSRVVRTMISMMRMIMAEQKMTEYDVKGYDDADLLTITTYGHTVKYVQSAEREIVRLLEDRVRTYYGDAVVLHVIKHDRVPQQILITQFMPYIIMICVAIGLVAGVLAIFHIYDRMREENENEMAHLDGKKIFEKFHVSAKKQEETTVTEENKAENKREKRVDAVDEMTVSDIKEEEKKDDVKKSDVSVHVEKHEADDIRQGVHDVVMPDGLQTIPGNLPVVDVSALGFSKKQQRTHVKIDEGDVVPAEPTEEELKARLNELLSGKM